MKPTQPKQGQESVWDYPRPPRLERMTESVEVVFAGKSIARTNRPIRILETSHPPTYYIPVEDIDMAFLTKSESRTTFCEWKGYAEYWDIRVEDNFAKAVGWSYPVPSSKFAELKDHIAFYPSRMGACYINGELVTAQEGDFYGGWITSKIVGPFKGAPGTWGW